MEQMIYLDNSATTRPYEEVLSLYTKIAREYFGNPSSLHTLGMEAERVLTHARERVAAYLLCQPDELLFTSGGTEANGLVIHGVVQAKQQEQAHIIATTMEHASVYESLKQLEATGVHVTYIAPNADGHMTVEAIEQAIRPETVLVTIGHVQGELGFVQPIAEIGAMLARYPTIRYHVDAVQSLTKVAFSLVNIDFLTISAHKVHGLKGTGALFVRNRKWLRALYYGGSQEQRLRPGTENVAGAAAFAKAIWQTEARRRVEEGHLQMLQQMLWEGLETISGIVRNTPMTGAAPHILNVSVPGIKAEVLVQALGQEGIYVSTQSACSTKTGKPSRVLLGAGFPLDRANSAIRFSFSYETTTEDIQTCIAVCKRVIPQLIEVIS
ncbi:cysteine desulfurase family protein [Bacillus sp. FSL W7-1360]